VVAQVTLSVALVAAGSLVVRSMQRVLAIDPGYQAGQVLTCSTDLSLAGYGPDRGTQFYLELVERASRLPGVRSASLAKSSPATDWSDRVVLFRQGEAPAGTAYLSRAPGAVTADRNIIAPNYFRTLGIPLLAGRDFALSDRGVRKVAIVSKTLADRLWPNQDALGKQFLQPIEGQPLTDPIEVVGVAGNARYRSVLDAPPLLVYEPLTQNYDSIARLMIAVDGPAGRFKSELPRLIQQADPDLPVRGASTLQEQTDASLWRMRAAASLLSLFGALAIALACAGIYGVVAYTVARRVREIGIRMALGAERIHVVRQVAGQAVGLAAAGILLGIPLSLWSKPALASVLYGSPSFDAVAIGTVPLLFLGVALAASYLPARRAAAVDPAVALRQE
jgi:predicted permease